MKLHRPSSEQSPGLWVLALLLSSILLPSVEGFDRSRRFIFPGSIRRLTLGDYPMLATRMALESRPFFARLSRSDDKARPIEKPRPLRFGR
ncbi:hypothetical protein QR680_005213 [Steinernema hermaphroditum]|uniref:Uncharacterized protein n=1 Tax=Steinernema hermaphroditum TaxID=289476 RepID=A0AA39HR82_9BILA|nr:hypothetical protein QR680_005213 [Steinernema hermaphroditum]